jgi:CheY-like chemotaxis protein
MRNGPIILVDDDIDDADIMKEILSDLGVENKIRHFSLCSYAWNYLQTTNESPFIILCDVNIPQQNGLEFKKQIDQDQYLRQRSIPFIFYSTSAEKHAVDEAYKELTIQGFFKKQNSIEDLTKSLKVIIAYWKLCHHPNSGSTETNPDSIKQKAG